MRVVVGWAVRPSAELRHQFLTKFVVRSIDSIPGGGGIISRAGRSSWRHDLRRISHVQPKNAACLVLIGAVTLLSEMGVPVLGTLFQTVGKVAIGGTPNCNKSDEFQVNCAGTGCIDFYWSAKCVKGNLKDVYRSASVACTANGCVTVLDAQVSTIHCGQTGATCQYDENPNQG